MDGTKKTLVLALALFAGSFAGTIVDGEGSSSDPGQAQHESLAVPKNAVMAFNRATCPTGWSPYVKAQGRTIVGLNPGGTLRATVGAKLGDKEIRKHDHVVDPDAAVTTEDGDHSHVMFSYAEGLFTTGSGRDMVPWSNGMDATGEGFYPIAVDFKGGPNLTNFFNTNRDGDHTHSVDVAATDSSSSWNRFPYVQLLMCVKN